VTVVVTVDPAVLHHVDEGLDAVRAQTHTNLEIQVWGLGGYGAAEHLVRSHAAADVRLRLRGAAPDVATARNRGASRARGDYLVFVDASDLLPARAVELAVASLQGSGSDLAIGRRSEVRGLGRSVVQPPDPLHDEGRTGQTLESCPVAVTNLGVENRVFRTAFWRSAGLAFRADDGDGAVLALAATAGARSFDVLEQVTYVAMNRARATAVGALRDEMRGLDDWLTDQDRKWATVEALGIDALRDAWAFAGLDARVQPLLDDVERASGEQWSRLREYVDHLVSSMSGDVWDRLRAESRVKVWLVRHDHRGALEDYVAARWFEQGNRPTEVVDGDVRAILPLYDGSSVGMPPETFVMGVGETPLVTVVRDVRWEGPHRIELGLLAWIDFVGHGDGPVEAEATLVQARTGREVPLEVAPHETQEVNHAAGHRYQDYRRGGLTVTVDVRDLVVEEPPVPDEWHLRLRVRYAGLDRTGSPTRLDPRGPADLIGGRMLADRRVEGFRVGPRSSPGRPFALVVTRDAGVRLSGAGSPGVDGRRVSGTLAVDGDFAPVAVRLRGPGAGAEAGVDRGRFAIDVPTVPGAAERTVWTCEAVDASGATRTIGWPDGTPESWLAEGSGSLVWARSPQGDAEVVEAAATLVVDSLRVEDRVLHLRTHWLGSTPARPRVTLTGGRAALTGEWDDSGTEVRFPLTWDPWGLGEEVVPLDRYVLGLDLAASRGRAGRVDLADRVLASTLTFELDRDFLSRPFRTPTDVGVVLAKPLDDDERSPLNQKRMQQWCLSGQVPLDPDSVYLQSYAGASATDSQLAIHHELRRSHPHLTLHWGVADRSCRLPEGAVPVLTNSREWYAALAGSTYLVNNIDFDRWFTKRPGQKFLQTFHGYPSKSMGIRLWEAKQFSPRRIEAELARTSAGWDLILTPTPEMDQHYRREYRYDGPIFSHGYPRDDALVAPDADRVRRETRSRLGIGDGQTAVLYAPTWRDDLATNYRSARMAKHLDVEGASRALGPDFVMLMRGHRFHARAGQEGGESARFVDVTTYPEINDLILAADAAVLDYSSLRFDFALTGRPMLFLVPDLDTYSASVRGFLFPFASSAPGPLLDTAEQVIDALRDLERVHARHASARDSFHAEFNSLQDGHSAEAVVREFFGPAR
jgi:CDP-glycerol glycerophosphotransferase